MPNPESLEVQVMPSVEVVKVPEAPPATYRLLPKVSALIAVAPNPEVHFVQVIPSVEVVRVPPAPPAT